MSWESNSAALKSSMNSLGYKRVPDLLDLDERFQSKLYHIEVNGVRISDITDNTAYTEFFVTLSCGYVCTSNEKYDEMVDNFYNVISAIKDLDEYSGFTDDAEIVRMEDDNKKIIASVKFIYGVRTCS